MVPGEKRTMSLSCVRNQPNAEAQSRNGVNRECSTWLNR